MKNYKRSIISGVLVFAMCMGTVMRVQATTIEEAQEKASQLDEEKETQNTSPVFGPGNFGTATG